jgi:hypothetical protein
MNPRKPEPLRFPPAGRAWTMGLLLLASCAPGAGGRRDTAGEGAALEAFRRGEFDQAEALGRGATGLDSRLLQARLHLLRNRPKEAVDALYPLAAPYRPFTEQMPAKYDDIQVFSQVLLELGQAYVRADDFFNAARVYWALGDNILSRKYAALGKVVAYLPADGWTETSLELEGVDPIPHVTMGVNGRSGVFLIDTSTDEIVIERDFAKRAGLTGLGYRTTQYNVAYDESTADLVTLGKLAVRNVPVHLGRLPAVAKVRADGAVGLAFLMHFDFTIDYRRSRLTLRRAGAAPAGGLPAVLAGDRHLLVQGSVNGRPGSWIAINTAMPDVVVAASPGMAGQAGMLREIAAGPLRLTQPPVDTDSFPTGLDGGFGFPAGFMLAHHALRDHSIRLEPRSMRIFID